MSTVLLHTVDEICDLIRMRSGADTLVDVLLLLLMFYHGFTYIYKMK